MRTIAIIGDSQGVGLKPPLTKILDRRGVRIVGAEVREGWSTARMLAQADLRTIVQARPDVVLVVLGGNDAADALLPGQVAQLVGLFQAQGSRVVWIGPAHTTVGWLAERKAAVARVQHETALQLGFEWHDGRAMTADLPHAPDGVHFRRPELARWAERVEAVLFGGPSAWTWVGLGLGLGMVGWFFWVTRR